MRGDYGICGSLFSYIGFEKRVRADHPLRVSREIANAAVKSLSAEFCELYSPIGRGLMSPERRIRAMLLQAFYSIRSGRQPHASTTDPMALYRKGPGKEARLYFMGHAVMENPPISTISIRSIRICQSRNAKIAISGHTEMHLERRDGLITAR